MDENEKQHIPIDTVLVIGSGPSAAAFCKKMTIAGQKVSVVTEGKIQRPTYSGRLSKIQDMDQIWKFLDTQPNLKVKIQKQDNFDHIAINGIGGLSERWGGGISKLTADELCVDSDVAENIFSYYDFVNSIVGDVDNSEDPLSSFVGRFTSSNKIARPTGLTRLTRSTSDVSYGKSAQAVLHSQRPDENRLRCNFCGHCSIFCGRGSFYSASLSFLELRKFHQVFENTSVIDIKKCSSGGYNIYALENGKHIVFNAPTVVMAAGPVNTYKILTNSLLSRLTSPVRILNTPLLRGLAFSFRGEKNKNRIVGSTIARLQINDNQNALVTFVDGQSIPISDWLSFLPFNSKLTAFFARIIRRYFMAYMVFFSSDYSNCEIKAKNGTIVLKGGHHDDFQQTSINAIKKLKVFLKVNHHIDLPFLRETLVPGRDIHCGGTLPLGGAGDNATTSNCELQRHLNIFIIDGSWMPRISEKSHTFTLMANAARVADIITKKMIKDQ